MPNQRDKSKTSFGSVYLDAKFVKRFRAELKKRGITSTQFLENAMRRELEEESKNIKDPNEGQ